MMIKNIIIFLFVFLAILWLQHNDDLKYKINRKKINSYDIIKLPLFVSCVVILLLEIDCSKYINYFNTNIIKPITNNNKHGVFNDVFTEQPDF
jgi:hypothetical protein